MCDNFFGSYTTADSLANRKVGFLFLVPKNTKRVPEVGAQLPEGAYRVGDNKRARCSLYAFKVPKVGSKAGRVVPFLTSCDIDAGHVTHARGYQLPTVVRAYRQTSNGVDRCNQLALTNRMRTWSAAVRALVMRYAARNAYTASNSLGVRDPEMTRAEFQWCMIKGQFPEVQRCNVHVPIQYTKTWMACKWCGGETNWTCSVCGVPVHVKCFGAFHQCEI